jgi:hypothetical protein
LIKDWNCDHAADEIVRPIHDAEIIVELDTIGSLFLRYVLGVDRPIEREVRQILMGLAAIGTDVTHR